jgi:DNA recombination protein Rad52
MDWDKLNQLLQEPLDRNKVKPPPQGKYGEYVEGFHVIEEANRIFGNGGWSYETTTLTMTNASESSGKHHVGYLAVVRVQIGDVVKSDVGHGQGHGKSEGDCHDSAAKEAVTDALKRSLRTLGYTFGLALYDKTQEHVADMEVEREAARLIANITTCATLEELGSMWREIPRPMQERDDVQRAKDTRKAELLREQKDAA